MRAGAIALVIALGAAPSGCGKAGSEASREGSASGGSALGAKVRPATGSPEVKGSFTIDGQPQAITACAPGHAVHTYLVLRTTHGALRFEDGQLYWSADPEGILRGNALPCDRLDRSWGGGVRPDGSAYWRGILAFDCRLDGRVYVGDVEADCGKITAEERQQLDSHRQELRDDQRRGSSGT